MSKQREALMLALDALSSDSPDIMLRASVAIREALAEPEQKPVAVVASLTGDPVTMSWHHEPALPMGTKLYTAPPARKPLTDDEVMSLALQHNLDATWNKQFFEFARAIERAHGIE